VIAGMQDFMPTWPGFHPAWAKRPLGRHWILECIGGGESESQGLAHGARICTLYYASGMYASPRIIQLVNPP
jgi:hypothetical protein